MRHTPERRLRRGRGAIRLIGLAASAASAAPVMFSWWLPQQTSQAKAK